MDSSAVKPQGEPLLVVKNLQKRFHVHGVRRGGGKARGPAVLKAVDGVSFSLKRGESLGLAGESGCGKTTTGKLLVKLLEPSGGTVQLGGRDVTTLTRREDLMDFRRRVQLMFQNPYEALNPRFTIERSLLEPLLVHRMGARAQQKERVAQALESVNLRPAGDYLAKYPHQLSGGQLQRIVLARALITGPEFLVADEPVSMLDVSIRAGVLNLMREVVRRMGLTTIYISHDLSLIQYMCENTAIMYLGAVMELGPTAEVSQRPRHPYALALISSVPVPDPEVRRDTMQISGEVPSPIDLPSGCRFRTRCPLAQARCAEEVPELREVAKDHFVACHFA